MRLDEGHLLAGKPQDTGFRIANKINMETLILMGQENSTGKRAWKTTTYFII
jgi:hypothetical protein